MSVGGAHPFGADRMAGRKTEMGDPPADVAGGSPARRRGMPETRLSVFCDYENMSWYAQRASDAGSTAIDLDPRVLGLVARDLVASESESPVALAEVRVYRTPTEAQSSAQCHARDRVIEPLEGRTSARQIESDRDGGRPKQIHSQLTVDLFNWASDVSADEHNRDVAIVVLSADRECAPVMREMLRRFHEEPSWRVAFGGWSTDEGARGPEWTWLTEFGDHEPRLLLLSWNAYERQACEAQHDVE